MAGQAGAPLHSNVALEGPGPSLVNLWPLKKESGDLGIGRLSTTISQTHKYFPWHKVKQARTSGATGYYSEQ